MKKIYAMLLALTVTFAMAACSNETNDDTLQQDQTLAAADDTSVAVVESSDTQDENTSATLSESDDSQNATDTVTESENADSQSSAEVVTVAESNDSQVVTSAASESNAPQNTAAVVTSSENNNTQNVTSAVTTTSETTTAQNTTVSEEQAAENASEQGGKILVAYFSRVGNTVWDDNVDAVTSASLNVVNGDFAGNAQLLAEMAQDITGGDLFLIQTDKTYPSNYRETTDVASDEQRDNARPALASHVENMDQYDTIILIYPNWWGTLPQPLFTFLEEYDFSGKTIMPLCTHEGSRMGSSERDISSACDATLLAGLDVRGSNAANARSDVEKWIKNSGILE